MTTTMIQLWMMLAEDRGAVFPVTIVFSLLVTISGMAFLSLASSGGMLLRRPINETKALYLAEGGAHKAVWKMIRQSPDGWVSCATFSDTSACGVVDVGYDSTSNMLQCTGTVENANKTVSVNVSVRRPTDHVIAYTNSFTVHGAAGVLTYSPGHGPAQFDVLPYPDMVYYQSIADVVYAGNQTFQSETLNGIHFVNGNVRVKNGTVVNGTIVATGTIRFYGGSLIVAQHVPGDSLMYYPAVISFADSESDVMGGSPGLFIFGLVYASGAVNLNPCHVTGCIMAPDVELQGSYTVTHDLRYGGEVPGFIWPDGSFRIVLGMWNEN